MRCVPGSPGWLANWRPSGNAAPVRTQDAADEIAEPAARYQRVVEVVMELDEPYRATILLRFVDDLPTAQVARRMAVPIETACRRLKRGLCMLRGRLDARSGGSAA